MRLPTLRINQTAVSVLTSLILTVIVFATAGMFSAFETTKYDDPYIRHVYSFSYELAGGAMERPDVWVDQWFFQLPAPYKYRLLGKIPIYGTYQILQFFGVSKLQSLYCSYLGWTAIFLFSFLLVAGRLVRLLVEDQYAPQPVPHPRWLEAIAMGSLALLPPILFAFHFPVHGGPNDFLGYTLIALALLAIRIHNLPGFVFYALLGLFCRETNAIVLAPLLMMPTIPRLQRAAIIVGVLCVLAVYRLAWPGGYNPFSAATLNMEYFQGSLLFLFIVFGPFWLLGAAGMISDWRIRQTRTPLWQALYRSYWPSTVAVLVIVWSMARVREIRLEYILFFYVVPFGISFVWRRWAVWRKQADTLMLLLIGSIAAGGTFWVNFALMPKDPVHHAQLFYRFGQFYAGFGGGWRGVLLVNVALTLLAVGALGLEIRGWVVSTAGQSLRKGSSN